MGGRGKVLADVPNCCITGPWTFNVASRHRMNVHFHLTEKDASGSKLGNEFSQKSHIWEATWLLFGSPRPAINPILIATAPITAVRLAAVGTSYILSSAVSLPLIWPGPLVPAVTDSCLTWGPEKAACREIWG